MRNLFSVILGLLSALIYAAVRLVLLLDRVVCAIWALPLWKRLAGGLCALRGRRAAAALAVFVPLFAAPSLLLTHSGTLVTLDGRPIGTVQSAEAVSAAVADIQGSATALQGEAYVLPTEIKCTPTRTASAPLDDDALKNALIESAGDLGKLAVIEVDGERAGACRSAEDAQTLLDRVKAQYVTVADEQAEFLQAVRVDSVVAPLTLASDAAALYESLAPRLDVSSTRAVTYTEEIPFSVITRENDALDQTHKQTLQQGQAGEAVVTAEITTIDGREQGRAILERTVLSQATDEVVEVGTKSVGIGTGEMQCPLTSYTFTSAYKWRWGRLHGGVDLAVDEGAPVYAADNGKVIVSEGSAGGYGNYVILDHQNGLKTLYGHNSQLLVSVGDVVSKGDKIALSGNTGNSTGPHVHFEVHVDDERVDPQMYVTLS